MCTVVARLHESHSPSSEERLHVRATKAGTSRTDGHHAVQDYDQGVGDALRVHKSGKSYCDLREHSSWSTFIRGIWLARRVQMKKLQVDSSDHGRRGLPREQLLERLAASGAVAHC